MPQLDLRDVTFVCGDSNRDRRDIINHIIAQVSSSIEFGEIVHETNIPTLTDYNLWITKKLKDIIKTEYCLIFQWDGFPVNAEAWRDDWLDYDYIGAPWLTQPWPEDQTVGNGGFSLRSRKYLELASSENYNGKMPEDEYFCRQHKLDCSYAPVDQAFNFAVEDIYYKGQFGFHGIMTILMNNKLAKQYDSNVDHELIRWAQRNSTTLNLAESYEIIKWYKSQKQGNMADLRCAKPSN